MIEREGGLEFGLEGDGFREGDLGSGIDRGVIWDEMGGGVLGSREGVVGGWF